MAKVSFTKLKCKIDDSVKQVELNDEISIEVKQYLPVQEKLALIGRVIMQAKVKDSQSQRRISDGYIRYNRKLYNGRDEKAERNRTKKK